MVEINRTENGSKGSFEAVVNGKKAGKLTYSIAGEDKIILNHTEVDKHFNGQGIGKKLVMKSVDYARENNIKIIPLCPFAKALFEKIEDIRDVLT